MPEESKPIRPCRAPGCTANAVWEIWMPHVYNFRDACPDHVGSMLQTDAPIHYIYPVSHHLSFNDDADEPRYHRKTIHS